MKRNNWFVNYENQRDLNYRIASLNKSDFEKATVIDIGCNSGQMSRYASDCGADHVLGVDYDVSAITKAREYSKNYKNIVFLTDDIDNFIFYINLPDFDICLFLSVIGTKELTNRYGILAKISSKIKKVMYIEGHHSIFKKTELLESILKYTTFTSIEYLGKTYDNKEYKKIGKSRDIFRCSRNIYTKKETLNKIVEILNQNDKKLVAVYGHGGVGKTTFKKYLLQHLNDNTEYKFNLNYISNKGTNTDNSNKVCILDDVAYANIDDLKKKYKVIIYMDYRVLQYTRKYTIDTLFIMNYDIKLRYKNRPQFMHDRSLPITRSFIKNIYHMEQF